MDFQFTEEQLMIQKASRDYAQRELIKDVLERDAKAEYPTYQIWRRRHGYYLLCIGYGGDLKDRFICFSDHVGEQFTRMLWN